MNKDLFLNEKLKDLRGEIPLNYTRAKLSFSNEMDFNAVDMAKFIVIEKYKTSQMPSSGPNKPISRVFNLKS